MALMDGLTDRETEVIRAISNGETDAEAAKSVGCAIGTVRSHLRRIKDKTGLHRRGQLIAAFWKEQVR